MKKILLCMVLASTTSFGQELNEPKMIYPPTPKGKTVDIYFDSPISDPYRWLEDDRSNETAVWVKSQNQFANAFLSQIPFRQALKTRMEELWNFQKIGAPFIEGKQIYYFKNNGLQNQSVLYQKDKKGVESVFLDPNTFSKNGSTSLGGVDFSKDGSKLAYSISEGGSDWHKVILMDVPSRQILEDTIHNVKFSGISWKGNDGFYYSSYDKPKGSELSDKTDQHKLYFHKLGTSQKEDKVIFGLKDKRRYVAGFVSEDQRFLVISAANSTYGNELYVQDLSNPNAPIVNIVDNFDSENNIITTIGDKLFIETDLNAPNKRIVGVDFSNPKPENWKNIIPQSEHVLVPTVGGGYFFANYLKDAISLIKQYDFNGKCIREIQLPGIGSVGGFSGKKVDETLYYTFTNYTTPTTIYSFKINSGKSEIYQKPKVDFKPEDYISTQIFYPSKDGTKIPMIITHKKNVKLNGNNPTILYGYGGFNISLTPSFSISNAIWLENGGIYAVANLRGGGEYGKKWHDSGVQMKKQNVFDDFIAAAEFLISNNYTSKDFLAIRGGSNGGLLVGAVMTQRPDLFKVALPAVGVLDMLRYHTFTSGAGWAYDYGISQESKEMFEYLKGYSPVHNVKSGVNYPATMITTGDHDDRVVPAHSFKFGAELQEKQTGKNPILIRIDVQAGHGAGKSTEAIIQENVDIQAFTLFNMGFKTLSGH